VTSFGAAVLDGWIYYYGGNTGSAHSYHQQGQGNVLRRVRADKPGKWERLLEGPHLQGLALVAAGDKLYRLGGFTAKNAEGEDQDYWSQASVAIWDPARPQTWRPAPDLPEPRSSFDAAVLNDKIYVIGGWQLRGDQETIWHQTAYVLDTTAERPQWSPLPRPPFERRALAVAAHAGKIYAIGGMQRQGGPATKVDVYDPQASKWSAGPPLIGKGMDGFGASAFAVGGQLYVSTYSGSLQALSGDGSRWRKVRKLPTARFFHRMLPLGNDRLIVLGGANMSVGKYEQPELIELQAN
jgi:N-acetylneuraminic acid mutarotase